MLHLLFYGLLLGYGAAIPFGPINFEIIRRTLRFGFWYAWLFGLGAASADLVYLILWLLGATPFLSYPLVLKCIGIIGSLVIATFGILALLAKETPKKNNETLKQRSRLRDWFEGFIMTFLNPYTILFWASVSAQVASLGKAYYPYGQLLAIIGVLFAAISWPTTLCLIINLTSHKLSEKTMKIISRIGGIILIAFAVFGLYRAFS